MKTVFAPLHHGHAPKTELNRGRLVPHFERPQRADRVLEAVRAASLGAVEEAATFPLTHAARVHASDYLEFLQNAYAKWLDDGRDGDALPITWPVRGFRRDVVPQSIVGQICYYSFDVMTPIMPGTWAAAKNAADAALTAAREIASGAERSAFAICRPPGHHATSNCFGGYCFLNNAAIAAQFLRDGGAARVAILDVDYHHGNGTQEIFYTRKDVLYVSIHADPLTDFPYFLGHADERGQGEGAGYNLNLSLARGADWARWSAALDVAKRAVVAHAPDALVVSLGVDTFEGDELSAFHLKSTDFSRMGEALAELRLPTVLVLEGGYNDEHIGSNVVNVLAAFK